MGRETRATLRGATILQVAKLGEHAQIEIPGVGKRWIHQSGIHDDSEIYWTMRPGALPPKIEAGPGKLILNGWYASKVGVELD